MDIKINNIHTYKRKNKTKLNTYLIPMLASKTSIKYN